MAIVSDCPVLSRVMHTSVQSPDHTHFNPLAAGGWWKPNKAGDGRPHTPHHHHMPQSAYGALPLSSCPGMQSTSISHSGTITFRFISPECSNPFRFVNCRILGPSNQILYTVISNDPHSTIIRDCYGTTVAIIEWRSPSTMVKIRDGKRIRKEDFLTTPSGKIPTQCMWWNTTPYFWTADDTYFYLYADHVSSLPIAIVRASDPLFELETCPEFIQRGVLEPALVALIMMQWSRGIMERGRH